MSPVLALDGVTAGYVGDIDVLRDVSLNVAPSAITGLIGLNGAGKSTIMKTICGFLRPKRGHVVYDGTDITGLAPHRLARHGIWYIPQESSLFPYMSVENNLRLPLQGLLRATGRDRDSLSALMSSAAKSAPRIQFVPCVAQAPAAGYTARMRTGFRLTR